MPRHEWRPARTRPSAGAGGTALHPPCLTVHENRDLPTTAGRRDVRPAAGTGAIHLDHLPQPDRDRPGAAGLHDVPDRIGDRSADQSRCVLALHSRGCAGGTGGDGLVPVRAPARTAGRAAEADPDRSVRVLTRGHSPHHLRVWVPGGGGHAPPQLDLHPALDGHSLGSRHGRLHIPVSVKNRLRVLRAELDWSQAELAERLGVSRQTVNAIETGKYAPSLPLAFSLARTFKRPIEEIFDAADPAGREGSSVTALKMPAGRGGVSLPLCPSG